MAIQQINKRQIKESAGATSAFASDNSVRTYATTSYTDIANTTATITNAPPGDYAIDFDFSVKPGVNAQIAIATNSTGTLIGVNAGIHGSDSDYNTGLYAKRHINQILQGHPGGTFYVKAQYVGESTATGTFGLANDNRWSTNMRVIKVG